MARQPLNLSRQVDINTESDVAEAMRLTRATAEAMGFTAAEYSYLATVATELASNLLIHAGGGSFEVRVADGSRRIELVTVDTGPGIPDIARALQDGYSTAGGLGCGLPGVKRLMDGIDILSTPGAGTQVRAWRTKGLHART